VLLDSFSLGEDNLVVFNLVSHHLKFVAHPKEGYPYSRIGAVTSKAAVSVRLVSEIGLVHHHLPQSSRGNLPRALTLALAIRYGASLVLYGATYIRPCRHRQTVLTGWLGIMRPSRTSKVTAFPCWPLMKSCGSSQVSVTVLSTRCRWTLLHFGQVNVRKSWPNAPGSTAVSFIGEPQAVHCGPWFCLSSIVLLPQFGALSSPSSQPATFDLKGSDAVTLIST
jgi:hypothetical protein